MLKKQTKSWRNGKKSTAAVGIVLSLALLGAGGCGTTTTTTAASTPASSSSQQTGKTKQGQVFRNPAIRAVKDIRILENSQSVPLTTDQKSKLKPILQTLINASNPSQDFLHKQADAIKAEFTAEQKSVLAQRKPSQGNQQNGNRKSGTKAAGGRKNRGANNRSKAATQPTEIYQQVLNSLT